MEKPTTCPRCGGQLKEGFVLDHAYLSVWRSLWVEGKPEKSSWSGLKTEGNGNMALRRIVAKNAGMWICMRELP